MAILQLGTCVYKANPVHWKGSVFIQDMPRFYCNAYPVSGTTEYLRKELPSVVQVRGRIQPEQIVDYLSRIKNSTTREICVICLQASSSEAHKHYMELFSYLNGRNRCGVVGHITKVVKDMYIFPLSSKAPLPSVLLPFKGPGML